VYHVVQRTDLTTSSSV